MAPDVAARTSHLVKMLTLGEKPPHIATANRIIPPGLQREVRYILHAFSIQL
jgi:hypothetical protein